MVVHEDERVKVLLAGSVPDFILEHMSLRCHFHDRKAVPTIGSLLAWNLLGMKQRTTDDLPRDTSLRRTSLT